MPAFDSDFVLLKNWLLVAVCLRLLDVYHETGEFPDPVSLDEPSVSIWRTLPSTLCFSAALVAPFYLPAVRKAYLYTIAVSPLLILWLEVRKCA